MNVLYLHICGSMSCIKCVADLQDVQIYSIYGYQSEMTNIVPEEMIMVTNTICVCVYTYNYQLNIQGKQSMKVGLTLVATTKGCYGF